jgi:hypothetical protein
MKKQNKTIAPPTFRKFIDTWKVLKDAGYEDEALEYYIRYTRLFDFFRDAKTSNSI